MEGPRKARERCSRFYCCQSLAFQHLSTIFKRFLHEIDDPRSARAEHCVTRATCVPWKSVILGLTLQGVARRCNALQGVARRCKALQGFARHCRALGITRHVTYQHAACHLLAASGCI